MKHYKNKDNMRTKSNAWPESTPLRSTEAKVSYLKIQREYARSKRDREIQRECARWMRERERMREINKRETSRKKSFSSAVAQNQVEKRIHIERNK